MTLFAVLRSAAALAVTLGLLALAFRLLRRLQAGELAGRPGLPLHVLRRVALGPRQSVALVRLGDRVLVLSVADGGSSLLTELSADERAAALGGWFQAFCQRAERKFCNLLNIQMRETAEASENNVQACK